ncbi:PAS domain S-box protein [Pelagicoccus sp. SDUM812003]|uniref:hybrid sensor histidine kinase/response regulator n=1 Tax=Pelagicoccus sp. SDUM812003 TaxID=3041267 RepID=UPI00280EAB24|nr:PAS domain S-box protein [Pelagicoccus sp. SDUM812003]MDQ8204594.1 PAS domain S-box protein [Pelagicoccus sp. SDUM812003]
MAKNVSASTASPEDSSAMLEQLELEISALDKLPEEGASCALVDDSLLVLDSDAFAASLLGLPTRKRCSIDDCKHLDKAQRRRFKSILSSLFKQSNESEAYLRLQLTNGISKRPYCVTFEKQEQKNARPVALCYFEPIHQHTHGTKSGPAQIVDSGIELWSMDVDQRCFLVLSSVANSRTDGVAESVSLEDWIARIEDEDKARFRDSFEQLLSGKISSVNLIYRVRSLSGSIRYLSTIARRRTAESGERSRELVVGMHRDETEATNVIDDLKLFSYLAQKAQLSILVTDSHDCISWCNHAFTEVSGYELDEVFGKIPYTLLEGPATDQSATDYVRDRMRRGKAFHAELVQYKKNGAPYWVRVDGNPLVDENGQITRFILFQTDITETKKTQNAILRNEIKFRSLFDNSNDALLLLSPKDGVIIEANEAAVSLLDSKRLVGRKLDEVSVDSTFLDIENLNTLVEQDDRSIRESGVIVTSSGDRRPVELSVNRTPIGEAMALFVTLRDVSEKRALEEQLRHAQRMEAVGRLAGGIAHDFNNLLAGLRGFSELLCNSRDLTKKDHVYAHEILKITDRASKLTSRLLSFSRGKSDKPVVANLNDIVGNLTPMLSRILKKDIQFTSQLEPQLCNVRVDPSQIEQVIMNLVVNGQEAINSNEGIVTLNTSEVELTGNEICITGQPKEGRYAKVSVRDNGQGIARETLEKIFEPFFTTKKGAGTGLGLSIVYGIIQSNGGHLMVDSEVGRGTEFSFYFPQVHEEIPQEENTDHQARMPSAQVSDGDEFPTILVAEDQDQVREILELGLGQSGYNLLIGEDGAKAIELAEKNEGKIDLLLTDSIMPKANGFAVVKRVRELYPDIKVIMMSGLPQQEAEECKGLKIDAYVDKPFSIRKLLELIESLLGVPS